MLKTATTPKIALTLKPKLCLRRLKTTTTSDEKLSTMSIRPFAVRSGRRGNPRKLSTRFVSHRASEAAKFGGLHAGFPLRAYHLVARL